MQLFQNSNYRILQWIATLPKQMFANICIQVATLANIRQYGKLW